jgi:general L-amino acid transport system substrate-binding protein
MPNPADHVVLPDVISKEPLGPLVRHGDHQWGDVVRWSLNVMIIAEEKGLTSANVDSMKGSTNDPEVKRLLGVEGEYGKRLGLSNDFALNIVKMVGNYGESYERNIGPNTPVGLARGVNAAWNKGGILYSPPFR